MIPVTFNKDDLNNPKKGTVSPEAMSALVGLLYPTQVGVLDIFENPVAVTNVDLSTAGYVTLTFSKGYVICYGKLVFVEQGEQATLPLPASSETGNLGIRINLTASGASEVEWFAKSGSLRTDNLLNNPATGVHEIKLYSYTASSSSFVVGTRVATNVVNTASFLNDATIETPTATDNSKRLANTQFVQSAIENSKTELEPQGNISNRTTYTQSGDIVTTSGSVRIGKNLILEWGSYHTPQNQRQATLYFAENFSALHSITVTPFVSAGNNVGRVYVTEFSTMGFKVEMESDRINFCYMAIGRGM